MKLDESDTIEVITSKGKNIYEAKLTVIEFKQDGKVSFYCPNLDIITSDKSRKKAQMNLTHAIFKRIEEATEILSLREYLKQNGWVLSFKTRKYTKPGFFTLIKFNTKVEQTIGDNDFKVHRELKLVDFKDVFSSAFDSLNDEY